MSVTKRGEECVPAGLGDACVPDGMGCAIDINSSWHRGSVEGIRQPRKRACRSTDLLRHCQPSRDAASAISNRSLQDLRRQDHHGVAVDAVQSEASRKQSRSRTAPRRAYRPDGRLLEHGCGSARLARIHLHCAQPVRVHRLRPRLPKSSRLGRRLWNFMGSSTSHAQKRRARRASGPERAMIHGRSRSAYRLRDPTVSAFGTVSEPGRTLNMFQRFHR